MKKIAFVLGSAVVGLLPSCNFGPKYSDPELNLPPAFRATSSKSEKSLADLPWWKVYPFKELRGYIEEGLNNNRNVAVAAARVEQARQQITIARAPMLPWAGYGSSVVRGKNNPIYNNGATSTLSTFSANISWELDLWGKIRKQSESANALYFATAEAQRGVMLSLVSEIATTYFQLLQLDHNKQITNKTVESFNESLTLFKKQLEGGVGDQLQVDSALGALEAAKAQIPLIESQILALENKMCTLLGRYPGAIKRSGSLTDARLVNISVPAGLPASLLSRRPDIRQQEQLLRSANAEIGVAIANYFPSVSLSGSAGKSASNLGASLSNPRTNSWSLGADLTGPIFRGGQLVAGSNIAKQEFLAAKKSYEQSVINAMAEVSTILYNRQKLSQVRANQEGSVEAYKQAVATSTKRFETGLSSYYEVLTAQLNLYPQELNLSNTYYQHALTLVNLYTALGGGWNLSNPQFCLEKSAK